MNSPDTFIHGKNLEMFLQYCGTAYGFSFPRSDRALPIFITLRLMIRKKKSQNSIVIFLREEKCQVNSFLVFLIV